MPRQKAAGPPKSNDIHRMPSQPRLLEATGSDEPRPATDVTSRTNPGFLFISVFVCFYMYRFEGSQFEIALKLQKRLSTNIKTHRRSFVHRYTYNSHLADFERVMGTITAGRNAETVWPSRASAGSHNHHTARTANSAPRPATVQTLTSI